MQVNPKNIVVTLPRAVFAKTSLFKGLVNTPLNWNDGARWKEIIQVDSTRLFKFIFGCFHLIMFFPIVQIPILPFGIKSVDFPSLISSYLTFSQRPNSILLQGSREIPNFLCSIKWIL